MIIRWRALVGGTGLLLAGLLAGCQPADDPAAEIQVGWQVLPDPPRMGPATVAVTLADSLGQPIEGAAVRLEGTMTHPGMQPVIGEAAEVEPGRYAATLELTMSGDWVLLLEATLPDGRTLRRQEELPGVRAR